MIEDKAYEELEREFRNEVIEEVAKEIEKFEVPFGIDTVASFVVFVRNMKK
jgi:hypothetical protein